jgi:hypothetical protein
MFHELLAATLDMAVLPRVAGSSKGAAQSRVPWARILYLQRSQVGQDMLWNVLRGIQYIWNCNSSIIEAPCIPAKAGSPLSSDKTCRRGVRLRLTRSPQVETLRGMRSLEHFQYHR